MSLEPLTDRMKPTAVWLAGWYGDVLYNIGFTTYEGSDGCRRTARACAAHRQAASKSAFTG